LKVIENQNCFLAIYLEIPNATKRITKYKLNIIGSHTEKILSLVRKDVEKLIFSSSGIQTME
jgi:CDP-diacylglycerol pyrophosphatase